MITKDKTHYFEDGLTYDRITSILDYFLDPELVKWKIKTDPKEVRRIGRTAIKVGNRVDDLIKNEILGKRSELRKSDGIEVRNCMEGWRLFRAEHPEVKFVGVEKWLKSDELLVAGTLDIETEDSILDIKCAGKIGAKYWLQVAMYNFLNNIRRPNLAILRLHKSLGTYEYQTIPYQDLLVNVFIGLLEARRFYERYSLGDSNADDEPTDDKITEEPEVDGPEVFVYRSRGNW